MSVGTKNTVIPGCGMHHLALQTRDWEESLRLYRDVLGMEFVTEFGSPDRPIVLLDMGDGSCMELFAPTADAPAGGSPGAQELVTHISFATTDARGALERVRQAGFEVTGEARDAQVGTIAATVAFFKGPNGEIIELFEDRG